MLLLIVQIAVTVLAPVAAVLAARRWRVVRAIGPVVLCYAAGMALANFGFPVDAERAKLMVSVTVALAIPLLLFGVDVAAWVRLARTTLLSFAACLVAVTTWALVFGSAFASREPRADAVAGMVVGTYTGGSANLAAIGEALAVPEALFVAVNAADIAIGGIYLLFLLTVGPRLLGLVLRPFDAGSDAAATAERDARAEEGGAREVPPAVAPARRPPIAGIVKGVLLAAVCTAVGLGIARLVPEGARDAVTILGLTTTAITFSFSRRVRDIEGTDATGHFLLLVFCAAIGTLADLRELISTSVVVLAITALVVVASVLTHLAVARLLGVDRDTFIVTSGAGIFGPHLVPALAEAVGNRAVTLSGIAMGLAGYAVGNYLGLLVAWLLSG